MAILGKFYLILLYEQENRKSIESMMIWKLTEELELEVDQAEKFFQDLGSIEWRWRTLKKTKIIGWLAKAKYEE